MNKEIEQAILASWNSNNGLVSTSDLLEWINFENEKIHAKLTPCSIGDNTHWFYDKEKSIITNRNDSFFTVCGLEGKYSDGKDFQQPIIVQNEVGYLGFIGKIVDGVIYFLMQAKIEPGNVNNVQISPTIQATKSNFTQKHGGRKPNYFDYFENSSRYLVIYDGEEPEQCSRFFKKFNRNVIILINEEIDILPSFRWMSIGQIKYLADHYNNLVNMDTRTVLSCLPYGNEENNVGSRPIFAGEDRSDELIEEIDKYCNRSSFNAELIRLDKLVEWSITSDGIKCDHCYPFEIGFFDISIEGREVTHWTQPLAIAKGKALFGLLQVNCLDGIRFLIKIKEEVGCSNVANFGPTIQKESNELEGGPKDIIENLFFSRLKARGGLLVDTILSEEGGRFYHEENRNIIISCNRSSLPEKLPNGYFLANYQTLWNIIAKRHLLNIQLRDLMSLLETNNG